MSLIQGRYVIFHRDDIEKEIFDFDMIFLLLIKLLETGMTRDVISEDNESTSFKYYVNEDNDLKFDSLKIKDIKHKENHYIIHIMFIEKYSFIVNIDKQFFNINFKSLISRDPILLKYEDDFGQILPDFDVYKINDKYKFRFPCSNQNCKKRESLTSKFSRCSNCLRVQYCSRMCQTKDWKTHKLNCKSNQN